MLALALLNPQKKKCILVVLYLKYHKKDNQMTVLFHKQEEILKAVSLEAVISNRQMFSHGSSLYHTVCKI